MSVCTESFTYSVWMLKFCTFICSHVMCLDVNKAGSQLVNIASAYQHQAKALSSTSKFCQADVRLTVKLEELNVGI